MNSGISKYGRFLLFGAFAIAVAGCLPKPGGDGGDGPVPTTACGTVLTANLVLQNDLNCAGPALSSNVAGLTIDLNGHTITATANGSGDGVVGPALSLKNGTIKGFDVGYSVTSNGDPATPAFTIDNVHFVGNHTGVLDAGDAAHVVNSTFEGGHAPGSTGLLLGQKFADAPDSVTGNTFSDLDTALTMAQWKNATISHNTFSANNSSVVVNFENSSIDVANNDIGGGGTGVLVANANNDLTIESNTVHDGLVGIWVTSEAGFPNFGSQNNVISGNTVSGQGAAGIAVVANFAAFTGMQIDGNATSHNGFAPGSATNAPAGSAPLDDGIYVNVTAGGSVTVSNNHSTMNADHGIATVNVTDGGGNTASANGAAQQCSGGVACS